MEEDDNQAGARVAGFSLLFCKLGYGRLIDLGAIEQTRQPGSSFEC